ncbi:alpha DNA polymerase [Trichosporon asahii var. asahii CBS 8904]|uniref:DNA polymerase alpha subunit B n=1 Tax=Trichosporon asahii var. asahii (strain CBS 8904) TaxID=1220162 RepID=K1V250_TRIAC|nr:alpha DNA polymerase [Trichosporon asahii var. asahii CBS 8904]
MTATTQPFHARAQPHHLQETLNGHLSPGSGVPAGVARPRVQLTATEDPKAWDYRYMFEKMSARSEALDEQIDTFAFTIMDAYGLTELGDPHVPAEDATYTVGRILSPPTDSNKATVGSLYLQSSRQFGGGNIVPLRFSPDVKVRGGAPGVRGFGLFPGCLVCVKGRNGGGDAYVADEVLMPPAQILPSSLPDEIVQYQQGERLGGLPMSIYSCAGPYTLDNNLEYEPLDALVDVVCDERPDAVIMLGPFVDAHHPAIASGALRQTPVELFRQQIASRLARINEESPGTVVILIPSVRDLLSRHAAFPQAMLERDGLGLSKRVKVLPNPCTFSLNEVVISTSSVDTLFHLRREELFQRAEEAEPDPSTPVNRNPQGDAMANLVRHVLGQRSFYPLFPAPEALAHEVNLDVTHWDQMSLGDTAPDVLILPSKLRHFSKIVDETLVVNPGHLSRANAPGTFAKITVHPSTPERLEQVDEEGYTTHGVAERARSEVWRI